jgi:hypothetical protein
LILQTEHALQRPVPEKFRWWELDAGAPCFPEATEVSMNATNKAEADDKKKSKAEDLPAAGPHDKPDLQDPMKTPGAGTLPKTGSQETDVGSD